MKKLTMAIIILIIVGSLVAIKVLTAPEQVVEKEQQPIPVEVEVLQTKTYDVALNYVGAVGTSSIQSLSFKSGGKLEDVYVEVGDKVTTETLLARLDTTDMTYDLKAAKSNMNGAWAQYALAKKGASDKEKEQARLTMEKAKEGYEFQEETLSEYGTLLEAGAISQKEYDQLNLQTELADIDYQNAQLQYEKAKDGADKETLNLYYSQYAQAKTNVAYKESLIQDADLYATMNGTVVDVAYEPNTLVSAGYPIVSIRSEQQEIVLGVTDEDYNQIQPEDSVMMVANGVTYKGSITRMADVPDADTHLYEVAVLSETTDKLLIGEIVDCRIITGQQSGILVPIDAVIVNGETYVYVMEDQLAKKRIVTIEHLLDDQVVLSGIEEGEALIVNNIKKVHEGTPVVLVEE